MMRDDLAPTDDAAPQPAMTILIIDNHPLFRAAVEQFLQEAAPGTIDVVGLAATLDVLPVALAIRPDIVLIDLGLTEESDLNVVRTLRGLLPQCALVALDWEDKGTNLHPVYTAGADTVLFKDSLNRTLLPTMLALMSGMPPKRHFANREPDQITMRTHDAGLGSTTGYTRDRLRDDDDLT